MSPATQGMKPGGCGSGVRGGGGGCLCTAIGIDSGDKRQHFPAKMLLLESDCNVDQNEKIFFFLSFKFTVQNIVL